MTKSANTENILAQINHLNEQQLRRLLVEHITQRKLGLYWEANALERDEAINGNVVLPRLVPQQSYRPIEDNPTANLIIEGDNFDSLRLLRATHRGKIRVIYIDPPYNTGNKDWVYNDHYVGKNDRWRHSLWLEFLYRRLILARDLMTPDGIIMVSINDENRAKLELLMDEVFPGRRLGSLVWRTKDTGSDLSRRFSHVHEHILVYANPDFKFNGRPVNRSKFRNPDDDPRGIWSPQPLTKAHTYTDRENTYYPIQDPDTGYWYPCDPNRVWAYASEKSIRGRLAGDEAAIQAELAALRSDTIEQLIDKKLIYFPPCTPSEVMLFNTREELLDAIRNGKGPKLPKKKTPLLKEDLPDLDFWIGKPIAPGRPSRKEHWTAKPEEDRIAPLSSWIAGINEEVVPLADNEDDEPVVLRSTRGGVATEEVKAILGSKAFQNPKPLSLIKGLLQHATHPGDIVLDFFGGSGTTAQAVLELNAERSGDVPCSFILCSNTEANDKEPKKNLCRDVTATRVRRVMQGYDDKTGLGGDFAYLQLDLFNPADLPFEATSDHAFLLLGLREGRSVPGASHGLIRFVAGNDKLAVLLCEEVTAESLELLNAYAAERLAVYSTRPDSVRDRLTALNREANSYSVLDALLRGQTTMQVQ